ncbi:MAG: DNA polymerase III subunit beta [Desulfomicrobium sp.]|nr:DNA polymerase III subunit beta [Desulfomicrobium sp.]NLV97672.1 DNA polymerase III subunit beta [Desulfovibrionales bacterium]
MFLKVRKENIIDGLMKASGIIPSKTGAAYLRTIWLKGEGDMLSILATDSSIEFVGSYPAVISEGGLVGVSGRKFSELMRKMPPGEITLKVDASGKHLHIEQGRRKYKLPTNESSWFQEFTPFPENNAVLWSGDFFREVIDRISFCIADDEELGYMNCIKFSPAEEDDVEVCGLNGHQFGLLRFANAEIRAILGQDGFLVSKRYLMEMRKWLTSAEIEISLSDKRLFLRTENQKEIFSLPLKSIVFSDYRNFINQYKDQFASSLIVDRHELTDALDRIFIFNTEANKATFFDFASEELSLSCQGQDLGEGKEQIGAQFSGELKQIALTTKGILDITSHFVSDSLTFDFVGPAAPCRITGKDDPHYMVFTMPLEISENIYYNEESM